MTNAGKKFPAEILTEAEVRALIQGCSLRAPTGIRNRALITLLYRSGLRISEALALKPSDIDPARGTVRVLHGKGDKSRTVGLDDGAIAVIQRWLDVRRARGIRRGPLFCTLAGGEMEPSYIRELLPRLARKAGIDKRVHAHGFRHSHAADLVQEGVPVNVIQQQLGHAWLATTDVYLRHVAPADVIKLGRNRASWSETGE